MDDHVDWSDDVQDVMVGDLTAAVAYGTPAGGAVVASVSPLGLVDRPTGTVSFTTSLGFGKKLEHILRNRRLAICYHARTHGFSTSSSLVLAQGIASVDFEPSTQRLDDLLHRQSPYLGEAKSGPVWDWILREYHRERVFVDIHVERLVSWPELSAAGPMSVDGRPMPPAPQPQAPPARGTGPRVDMAKFMKVLGILPHRLLASLGADGYPVIVPVTPTGWDQDGILLRTPDGPLPPGARRAGLLAHRYNAQCVGLTVALATGWLDSSNGTIRYAPHTLHGLSAPPLKTVQALGNGMLAKYGLWQARRQGTLATLHSLAARTGGAALPHD
ncbi:MAG TPA: hypothetical protein VHX38_01815 [Pseudonocardiaceae bacterium]|nr:hypothetical protein [Pseudonocardiaceae bacterium]